MSEIPGVDPTASAETLSTHELPMWKKVRDGLQGWWDKRKATERDKTLSSGRPSLSIILLRLNQINTESDAASYYWSVPARMDDLQVMLRVLAELRKGDEVATKLGFNELPHRAQATFSLLMSVPDLSMANVYKLLFKLEGHNWDIESLINDGALIASQAESDGVEKLTDNFLSVDAVSEIAHDKKGLSEVFSAGIANQTPELKQWLELCWEKGYEFNQSASGLTFSIGNVNIDLHKLTQEPEQYLEWVKSRLNQK